VTIANEIARDILAYLIDNPDSQDTFEGIVEWWLLDQDIRCKTVLIKEVLEELVDRGLVVECKGANSRNYYQINQARAEDIRTILEEERGKTLQ
jgi:hypothetical protein